MASTHMIYDTNSSFDLHLGAQIYEVEKIKKNP
jgi:hypothetical protein